MKNVQKGFTLIELMIVVAIIAILAAIAIPAYQDYLIRSQVSEGAVLSDGAKTAMGEFYSNTGRFPPANASAGLAKNTSILGKYVTQVDVGAQAGQIRATFGFLPNFFKAQTLRPDLIEAELALIGGPMVKEGALPRRLKEYVFLVCSAANLSTYCVTAHCEMVRMLGIEGPEPEQIALDHTTANLPMQMKALLNFAAKLNRQPTKVSRRDIDALHTYGYNDEQVLETVLMVGLAKFANFVAFGLGTTPDFDSSKVVLRGADAAVGSAG